MGRNTLLAWIGAMSSLAIVLIAIGATGGNPVFIVVGVVIFVAQAIKWMLLREKN